MHHTLLLMLRQYQYPNNQKQKKVNHNHKLVEDAKEMNVHKIQRKITHVSRYQTLFQNAMLENKLFDTTRPIKIKTKPNIKL